MHQLHVDRRAERRTEPDLLAQLLADPQTCVMLCDASGKVLVAEDGHLPTLGAEQRQLLDLSSLTYLGEVGDIPWLGSWQVSGGPESQLVVGNSGEAPTQGQQAPAFVTMQHAAQTLEPWEVELALPALALAAWHSEFRFCGRCGAPTHPEQAGWVQACEQGHLTFPRTDPAVIMPVMTPDDERLLLAHGARWQPGRFSVLAGFVEAGESAEQAVAREVAEEAGLVVDHVEVVGSQSWPFPRSLMLAYRARLAEGSTEIRVDGEEVTEAHFFTRAELHDAVASGEITLPSRFSIARRLIEAWWGGELPDGPSGLWS